VRREGQGKPQRPGVDVQTLGLGQLVAYAVPNCVQG
jgi:hypothetical protein